MKKDMKAMACKKPVSVVMASAMALAMTPAMAMADPTSGTDVNDTQVTINGLLNGDKVEAFLIADADINAANNLSYTFNPAVPAPYNTIDGLTSITSDDYTFTQGTDMQKAAGKIAAAIATGANAGQATAEGTTATLNLGSGYYLVRVTSTSGDARVYQNMVIDVSPKAQDTGKYAPADPVNVTAKQTPVTVTKGVGANYEHKTDLYKVGDVVPFKVTTAIPNYPNDSLHATFIIGDKPTAGLEIDPTSIQINGKAAATCADYTLTADKTGYSIAFDKEYILAHPGESIEVTYNAKLTSAAFSKSDTDVTGNTATVTFNPNPYDKTTVTPNDKTTVQTYGYVFPKVGEPPLITRRLPAQSSPCTTLTAKTSSTTRTATPSPAPPLSLTVPLTCGSRIWRLALIPPRRPRFPLVTCRLPISSSPCLRPSARVTTLQPRISSRTTTRFPATRSSTPTSRPCL